MKFVLNKKARGYCPYLKREHSITVEFRETKKGCMKCSSNEACGKSDGTCPIYQQV
ncbi:MAG: hypothetical protein WCS30_12725 [Selenomonadaceae bacterium]|jgi:hypothetical protein